MPELKTQQLNFKLLNNGTISQMMADGTLVNQVVGNELDGGLANFFIRVREGNDWQYKELLGPKSVSKVTYSDNSATWYGRVLGVNYKLKLYLADEATWFWNCQVSASEAKRIDITYVQDLGVGTQEFVSSNEAYASQYLDHFIEQKNGEITIGSRQNQSQGGSYPYVQQGAFIPLDSYSTDASQFLGSKYRSNNIPIGMVTERLENKKLQYERALTALRTSIFTVNQEEKEIIFYGSYLNNQPAGNDVILISSTILHDRYEKVCKNSCKEKPIIKQNRKIDFGEIFSGNYLTADEINQLFPKRIQEEVIDGKLLSFFSRRDTHVVLRDKEELQRRETGNIILANETIEPGQPVLAATQFMPGIFQSHVVFGNTNNQILTSHIRDDLNFFKSQGTRIYIEAQDGRYHLLGMPSAYVMYYNGADWLYQFANDTIVISSDAASSTDTLNLKFKSKNGISYNVLVTNQWNAQTMGEFPVVKTTDTVLAIKPGKSVSTAEQVQNLEYYLNFGSNNADQIKIGYDNSIIWDAKTSITNQIVTVYQAVSDFTIATSMNEKDVVSFNIPETRKSHQEYMEKIIRHLKISTNNRDKENEVESTNLIIRWFAHDALVHLLSPHGLEQYGGAAWGTRDVAQGPTEFFLALGHYQEVRKIITMLYSHQFSESGNWPQWFMFDNYSDQFADESHGDVIIWPLKVVVDYLEKTGDYAVLNQKIAYISHETRKATAAYTLADHIKKQLNYIKVNFLPGTSVSSYGDGDWDDTLQPANTEQKNQMASTWTEELTIETLRKGAAIFEQDSDLQLETKELARKMMTDFERYFMFDDVLPGFIKIDSKKQVTPIIHPKDEVTGISYRLLPLSQGILSGILVGNQVQKALNLIDDNLMFPDGVRLMDRPSTYRGGISTIFKRAEQSANFGREIGLLYVHAHIRFANAVAVAGDKERAWSLLQLVNPIGLTKRVNNASLRQVNTYFSSSDAEFSDRYDAQDNFNKLRNQSVKVSGGWRLYSSGPGIYIGTIVSGLFETTVAKSNRQEGTTIPTADEKSISIKMLVD